MLYALCKAFQKTCMSAIQVCLVQNCKFLRFIYLFEQTQLMVIINVTFINDNINVNLH